MAALTATRIFSSPNIFGRFKLSVISATGGIAQDDEWISSADSNLRDCKAAWVIPTAGFPASRMVMPNYQGTVRTTEDKGACGVEVSAAVPFLIFMVGR